jgi:prophage regulatory protein
MKVLSTKQVMALTGLSRVSVWRYERDSRFPKRVRLGPNRVGYRSDEIEAWIESRPRGDA